MKNYYVIQIGPTMVKTIEGPFLKKQNAISSMKEYIEGHVKDQEFVIGQRVNDVCIKFDDNFNKSIDEMEANGEPIVSGFVDPKNGLIVDLQILEADNSNSKNVTELSDLLSNISYDFWDLVDMLEDYWPDCCDDEVQERFNITQEDFKELMSKLKTALGIEK